MAYPTDLDDDTDFPSAEGSYAAGAKSPWASRVATAMKAVQAVVGIPGSSVVTSHDYRITRIEEGGYNVKRGGLATSNTAAQNGDALRALVAYFQGLGAPVEFYWPAGSWQINRAGSGTSPQGVALTGNGIVMDESARVSHRGAGILSTEVVFTSTTADDTLFRWQGKDNSTWTLKCRNGGARDMNIRAGTPGAAVNGVVAYGSDGMVFERFNTYAFGRHGFYGAHFNDSRLDFCAWDGCGSQTGPYAAVHFGTGIYWAVDAISMDHPRWENCARDLDVISGASLACNKIRIFSPKWEHSSVTGNEVIKFDGSASSMSGIFIYGADLQAKTAPSGAIPCLARFNSVGHLTLDGFLTSTASVQEALAYIRLNNAYAPTLLGVTANVGGTGARPPNGIVQLAGDIRMLNPYPDVKWGWNGSSFENGDGLTAPYSITKAAGATVTTAPNVVASPTYPPTV